MLIPTSTRIKVTLGLTYDTTPEKNGFGHEDTPRLCLKKFTRLKNDVIVIFLPMAIFNANSFYLLHKKVW
jgi:hypothetical protein